MLSSNLLLKGAVLGFSIAAPVGPIGVLCIRRSLADGRQMGLATGLGAATADALYGAVAAFGLTAVSNLLLGQQYWLGLVGGLFLCYLGARTFFSKPPERSANAGGSGLFSAYLSTLFLTLTNPMTIFSFVGLFAGFGTTSDYPAAGVLAAGVFLGSAFWWLLLSSGVAWFKSRLDSAWILGINRLSGAVIFTFGALSVWRAFSR